MTPDPAPAPARRAAASSLDQRLEAATGHDVDTLWTCRDRGVLDAPHAHLADQHRELAKTERGVAFHLRLLHRLSSGEFPVEGALLERIDRTVEHLEEATGVRDAAARRVRAALEPIEATAPAPGGQPLSADDQAVLLAIAGGAKLYEHLLTGRLSVTAATGPRIPYAALQQFEATGLVWRDTGHPVHAGQPVALTDAGGVALFAARRRPTTAPMPKSSARLGTWPPAPAPRP